eukprot:3281376-Pyramimonas_sp.AAC.1
MKAAFDTDPVSPDSWSEESMGHARETYNYLCARLADLMPRGGDIASIPDLTDAEMFIGLAAMLNRVCGNTFSCDDVLN